MSGECEECGEHCLECKCHMEKVPPNESWNPVVWQCPKCDGTRIYNEEEDEDAPKFEDQEGKHHCDFRLPFAAWGMAITLCEEDTKGRLWVGNEEYMSQVNFCPFCGEEAKVRVNGKVG
jgi:hypothetical protein